MRTYQFESADYVIDAIENPTSVTKGLLASKVKIVRKSKVIIVQK